MNDNVVLKLINEISQIKDLFIKLEKRFDVCFNNLSSRLNNNNNLHLENHQKLSQSFNDLKDDLEKNNPAIKEVYGKIDYLSLKIDNIKNENNKNNLKIQSIDQNLYNLDIKINEQLEGFQVLKRDLEGLRSYCLKENEKLLKNFEKIDALLVYFKDSIQKIYEYNNSANNVINSNAMSIKNINSAIESLYLMIKNHREEILEDNEKKQIDFENYVNEKISKIPKVKFEIPIEVSKEINIIKLNIENLVHQKNVVESNLRRLLLANQV